MSEQTNMNAVTAPQPQGIAGQVISTAGPVVLGIVAKKWPKSMTVMSALVAGSAAGVAAFQSYQAKDMTGFGASIAAFFGSIGAIIGRAKAERPVSL